MSSRDAVMDARIPLLDRVAAVLAQAVEVYRGTDQGMALRSLHDDLDEPLRVAIAGKMSCGKSTLLNALVGEAIAPTDAGECTRIRNAALGAAFLAADTEGSITMERVVQALHRELGKLGRLRTEAEFDRYYTVVNGRSGGVGELPPDDR